MLTLNEIRLTLERELLKVMGSSAKIVAAKQASIPSDASVYYQYRIEYSKTFQEEKGEIGLKRRVGALRVNIFTPTSTLISDDNDLAQRVEHSFNMKMLKPESPIVSDCKIYCETAYTLDVGFDSSINKYVFSIVVPFFCWA